MLCFRTINGYEALGMANNLGKIEKFLFSFRKYRTPVQQTKQKERERGRETTTKKNKSIPKRNVKTIKIRAFLFIPFNAKYE